MAKFSLPKAERWETHTSLPLQMAVSQQKVKERVPVMERNSCVLSTLDMWVYCNCYDTQNLDERRPKNFETKLLLVSHPEAYGRALLSSHLMWCFCL